MSDLTQQLGGPEQSTALGQSSHSFDSDGSWGWRGSTGAGSRLMELKMNNTEPVSQEDLSQPLQEEQLNQMNPHPG